MLQQAALIPSQVQLVANPSQPGQQMMILTPLPGNQFVHQNETNGQQLNSTQPGLLPIDQTMQPKHPGRFTFNWLSFIWLIQLK